MKHNSNRPFSRFVIVVFAVIVLAVAGYVGLTYWDDHPVASPSSPKIETITPTTELITQVTPPSHYPMPIMQDSKFTQEQLPPLPQSDATMRKALVDLLGSDAVIHFFRMQSIVRNIVVTVDNLPRPTVAARLLPIKPIDSEFLTSSNEDRVFFIAPENASRYTPYVHLMELVSAKKLVAIYIKFYPLFQQAYRDLGYPDGYFNDRLIVVIDHLLTAPVVKGAIPIVQPHVLYQFSDPALEASSAGQKILLRMGSENAERIKKKLRDIRHELTSDMPSH